MRIWVGCALAALGAIGAFASGCGSDDSGGSGGSAGSAGSGAAAGSSGSGGGAGSGGSSASLCEPGSGSVDLAGQWAVRADLDVKIVGNPASLVQLCPDPQTQSAQLVLEIDVTGSGTSYQQTVSVCEIALPTVIGGVGSCNSTIETEISPGPELTNHLPNVQVPDVAVALDSAEVGAGYTPAPFALVLGAALTDLQNEALPFWDTTKQGCSSSAADPQPADCVTDFAKLSDDDADGTLGVTLQAHAVQDDGTEVIDGTAAAVLRVAPTLNGSIQNPGCVNGTLTAKLEYSIVDSDVTLSGAGITTPRVIEQLPPFEILPSSQFTMVRANGEGDYDFDTDGDGTISCAEIAARVGTF